MEPVFDKLRTDLRRIRRERDLTQKALADKVGVASPVTISNTLTGVRVPRLIHVDAWARACGYRLVITFAPPEDGAVHSGNRAEAGATPREATCRLVDGIFSTPLGELDREELALHIDAHVDNAVGTALKSLLFETIRLERPKVGRWLRERLTHLGFARFF